MIALEALVVVLLGLTTISLAKNSTEIVVLLTDFSGYIYRYDMNTTSLSQIPISTSGEGPGDVTYDPSTDKVYWANIRADHIKRINLDGTGEDTVHPDTETTRGVAVDYMLQVLFYTEEKVDVIGRINLTDMSRNEILTGLSNPDAITLDMQKRVIYWSEMGDSPKISMIKYDLTDRTVLVDTEIKWPTGLALDETGENLYWCDGSLKKIKYINLATLKVTVLMEDSTSHYYDVDILGGIMYFIDVKSKNTFQTIPVGGGLVSTVRLAKSMSKWRKLTVITVTTCEDMKWGRGCNKTCGRCVEGAVCNKKNGHCHDGCRIGYTEPLCVEECREGTYGERCASTCGHCYRSDTCDPVTGLCVNGCDSGWSGKLCKDECPAGKHGRNCTLSCGHCVNGTTCHTVSGDCRQGCQDGWKHPQCKTQCDDGTFGVDCQYRCQCNDGAVCDKVTGTCPQRNNTVRVCARDRYGINCSQTCGQCLYGQPCNVTTGQCPGRCNAGWSGDTCQAACSGGRYGLDCAETCSCSGTNLCDAIDGQCIHPAQQSAPGSSMTIGLIVVVVILAILLIVAVIFVFRKRRIAKEMYVTDDSSLGQNPAYVAFDNDRECLTAS